MIYLLMFFISLFFIWLGLSIKENKMIKKFFIVIGLIIPCLMAGFRGMTVGTDTSGYVWNLYINAKNIKHFSGMISFSNWLYYSKDYLYLLITYVIGHNNLSFQLLLFIYELLIVIPIFIALNVNKKDDRDILFGMFLFYMTFYNLSLNMVRQSIAISFAVLSFSILKNKNIKHRYLKSFILLLIGYGFHDTSLFAILIAILYILFNSKKILRKNKKFILFIIICLSFCFLIFYKQILTLIAAIGLYSKADMYLIKYANFDFNYLGTLRNLFILIIVINFKKKYNENHENYEFIVSTAYIDVLIGLLGTFVSYADRIAYYLFFNLLFIYISILSPKSLNINSKIFLMSLFFIIYWIVVILLNNSNETLPYVFFN